MKKGAAYNGYYLLFSVLMVLCPFSSSAATPQAEIKNINYWSSPNQTRVVIDLSRTVEYTRHRLSNPDRLFFDLKGARISKEIDRKLSVGDGILKSVRAGQFDPDTVSVVLDIEKMRDFDAFTLDNPDGAKLVIDVNAKRTEKAHDAFKKWIIVIDPGHGGHDPGAIGPGGLMEKDVVLDIALKVRDILSKTGLFEVVMTRDRDVFIPLPERTAIARDKDADLFVSIHANASSNSQARGIETYLLNWTTDEEAIRVAARENRISVRRMKEKMAQFRRNDYLSKELGDLRRCYKRDESLKLAHYVQDSIVSGADNMNKRMKDLGVKQALFYVLVGAEMPSILAEVSFISNPGEEKLLSGKGYRGELARSIAEGIKAYIKSVPPAQKMAGSYRQESVARQKEFLVTKR